jgi:hypothetical protein
MKMERTFLVFLIHILEQMVEMKYSSLVQELYPNVLGPGVDSS